MNKILLGLFCLSFLLSCQETKIGIPKPRMYPKVEYPNRNVVNFDESYCNISFSYPDYFQVKQDEYFFEEKPLNPCWFDLNSKKLNSQVHCSYLEIKDRAHFDKLVGDSFRMAAKHNQKADYRREQVIDNPDANVYGLVFEMDGPVASPLQFFVTDSVQHFFRGSLYFNSKVNPDSIAPVYQFVKRDVLGLIETFQWN